jgi:bifunctional DNA-binding transcriptional regulator/antitoxin component of YhaV-PrlF toxin-antitoxin module
MQVVVTKEKTLTLPEELIIAAGWKEGTILTLKHDRGSVTLVPGGKKRVFEQTKFEDVRGILKYDGPFIPESEWNIGITQIMEEKFGHDKR